MISHGNSNSSSIKKHVGAKMTDFEQSQYINEHVGEAVDATLKSLWKASLSSPYGEDAAIELRDWQMLEPGDQIENINDLKIIKNQITRDLHHLFACILKIYIPEVAKIAAQNAAASLGIRTPPCTLKLRQIGKEVQVLRDTKHFIKDYVASNSNQFLVKTKRDLCLWVTLNMPEELNVPSISNTRYGDYNNHICMINSR